MQTRKFVKSKFGEYDYELVIGNNTSLGDADTFAIGIDLVFSQTKGLDGEPLVISGRFIILKLSDVKRMIEEHEKRLGEKP